MLFGPLSVPHMYMHLELFTWDWTTYQGESY